MLTDFAIEEGHNLDIAFLNPETNESIALNNDNYSYKNFKNPEQDLRGDQFTAEIRLVAVHVDETCSVQFASGLHGNVTIVGESDG